MLPEIVSEANVPLEVVAKLLGISVMSLQGAIICNALPIGYAQKKTKDLFYTYHVSPILLSDYIGVDLETVYELSGIKERSIFAKERYCKCQPI